MVTNKDEVGTFYPFTLKVGLKCPSILINIILEALGCEANKYHFGVLAIVRSFQFIMTTYFYLLESQIPLPKKDSKTEMEQT